MGRWDLEGEEWEALDRFRFSARDADAFRNATVILMTAFRTPEVTQGALDLGAAKVIDKPFEMSEMAQLVEQAC